MFSFYTPVCAQGIWYLVLWIHYLSAGFTFVIGLSHTDLSCAGDDEQGGVFTDPLSVLCEIACVVVLSSV